MTSIVVDIELLLQKVRDRPILWDKSDPEYKSKDATQRAWEEICKDFCADIDSKPIPEKQNIQRHIQVKWINMRDSWIRWRKKVAISPKGTVRNYHYADQLNFLKKNYPIGLENTDEQNNVNAQANDSSNDPDRSNDSNGSVINGSSKNPPISDSTLTKTTRQSIKRKANVQCQENGESEQKKKSQKVESDVLQNRHMSFFTSCLPPLATFNDDETLEFQIIVLNAIHGIRTRRTMNQ